MDLALERRTKHQRVAAYLDTHDLDAVLLSRRCNFSWYTCGAHNYVANACDVGNSFLLVSREQAVVIANSIEAPRLRDEELAGSGIDVVDFAYEIPAAQNQTIRNVIDTRRTAADAAPGGLGLPSLGGDFDRLRWVLTPTEIARYRAVCADTVAAMEATARAAELGMTENQLAGALASALRARGLVPWVLLVAADDRIDRFRHPLPTDRPVRQRFMLVAGAERCGLVAAHSRLACFGKLPAELARRQQAAATVDAALISSTRPGRTLGEMFATAQRAYEAVGYPDQWRLHHQGGPCGYLPREARAVPGDATPVLADQAFAWNPSITGAKSEDTILCTDRGGEPLAGPTHWPMLDASWETCTVARPAVLEL
jgi:Xaa-Pro aminopeptidase